jgi:DNA-binding MarR family transcriptional regulator
MRIWERFRNEQEEVRVERPLKDESEPVGPFASPAEAALLRLERSTDHLRREIHLMLRAHGLTWTQYNVLRILRSNSSGGITCSELSSRLAGADPDITRLLDRLARQRLVQRRRDVRDRRAVLTEITDEGRQLLESISPTLVGAIQGLFGHMAPPRLQLLIELLDEAMRLQRVELG